MLTQLVFTTSESKKLIAKAVLQLSAVQYALKQGLVVIHPSSTTTFLYEAITGNMPTDAWVYGLNAPGGFRRSKAAVNMIKAEKTNRKIWVFDRGILRESCSLDEVLMEMTENDIFIKGCNALDSEGYTAVVTSSPQIGGTFGKVLKKQKEKNFTIVIPVGLEKLIPGSISQVMEFLAGRKADVGMGLACGMIPAEGMKIDERDALKILCGVDAVPAAAGGLGGAEGAIVLYCDEDEDKTNGLLSLVETIKGAQLPELEL